MAYPRSGSAATEGLPANHANQTYEREYGDWGFHTGTALRGGLPTKHSKKHERMQLIFVSFRLFSGPQK